MFFLMCKEDSNVRKEQKNGGFFSSKHYRELKERPSFSRKLVEDNFFLIL